MIVLTVCTLTPWPIYRRQTRGPLAAVILLNCPQEIFSKRVQRGPVPKYLLDPAPPSVWPNKDILYPALEAATSPAEEPPVATSPVDSEVDYTVDTVGRNEEWANDSLLVSPDEPPRRAVSLPAERVPGSPAAAATSLPAVAATSTPAVVATSPVGDDDETDEDLSGSSFGSHSLQF